MLLKKIALIGAGPKSIAIAAKNHVLKTMGLQVPEIHIFEKNKVAANWLGDYGFTDGNLKLGTSPERDIGFPYQDSLLKNNKYCINQKMLNYSWGSYLIAHHYYSDWIDKGKPFPTHKEWGLYLCWVMAQIKDSIYFHTAEVTAAHLEAQQWLLSYQEQQQSRQMAFHGLVFTGPGAPNTLPELPSHPHILTNYNFWQNKKLFADKKDLSIAIIGAGENTASVLQSMMALRPQIKRLDVIAKAGMLYSRGENYYENRVYSQPEKYDWQHFSNTQKEEFIKRTDLGVMALNSLFGIAAELDFNLINNTAERIFISNNNQLSIKFSKYSANFTGIYDFIILSIGFDPIQQITSILSRESIDEIKRKSGITILNRQQIEHIIGDDLAILSLQPKLHLPMLASFNHGPGMANLMALGLVADKILKSYVDL